mmetsp:Transcript_42195/g.126218  ORF Transcript_42195/g.126218 Transcript_42195/m.126218 type:complete len:242 (-) Transcript_42195:1709-2434(-)
MATINTSGLVGGWLFGFWPGTRGTATSAVAPGARSGACSACEGARPNGFLLIWRAKPVMGTCDEFWKVISSCGTPFCRATQAMTPKPVRPEVLPGVVGARTGTFCGSAGPVEPTASSLPPSRSSRSRPPPPPPPLVPLALPSSRSGPRSSSCCTSRRLAWRSSSSYSSSSGASSAASGALVVMRVTNSSGGLWYTLLMRARSAIRLSNRPRSMTCESSRMGGLSPSTTCLAPSGFVESSRQ